MGCNPLHVSLDLLFRGKLRERNHLGAIVLQILWFSIHEQTIKGNNNSESGHGPDGGVQGHRHHLSDTVSKCHMKCVGEHPNCDLQTSLHLDRAVLSPLFLKAPETREKGQDIQVGEEHKCHGPWVIPGSIGGEDSVDGEETEAEQRETRGSGGGWWGGLTLVSVLSHLGQRRSLQCDPSAKTSPDI